MGIKLIYKLGFIWGVTFLLVATTVFLAAGVTAQPASVSQVGQEIG